MTDETQSEVVNDRLTPVPASVVDRIAVVETGHETNARGIEANARDIASLHDRIEGFEAALKAKLTPVANESAGLLQEVVDYLHWAFPAAPGTTTPVPPGVPSSLKEG
jgi:hypothetical protein